ncbi:TIGR02530 family flagellar biosynthesis protein [Halobacillus yeomjeoni]|uniref:Flagellar protein n=1 Tax=Halobacillus yeomjeoni TaxID=311194 RepID=A0A931HT35_9BACI|nr:TIGR02530 family flagellar biosynthesis protein [Halobacillus yeomjeoni]MBH0229277.1 flagellar protein [Halobacillus yeomjeoni]
MNPRIHQLHQPLPTPPSKKASVKPAKAFHEVLKEAEKLTVSKHARQRLQDRNIHISERKWEQISNKMSEAKNKGVTDSLIITDQATLVVSTKNHTVVTALDREEASSKIFTNINGTIVMED